MKQTLCILFGGKAEEYPISLISASSIINTCRKMGRYDIRLVGITRAGVFYEYTGEDQYIPSDEWHKDPAHLSEVFFQPGLVPGYLRKDEFGQLEGVRVDVFFPVLHGADGEGGPLQGLLETLEIPYVGCQQLAAAVMMDKTVANMLFDYAKIPQTPWFHFEKSEYENDPKVVERGMEKHGLSYPIFVKPANTGSSVGISKVDTVTDLEAALKSAFIIDNKILIEEGVVGRELEVAVLEQADGELLVSMAGEIIPGKDFYDYEDKYAEDSTAKTQIPAELSEEQSLEIRNLAKQAFVVGNCRGLARVDFFLRTSDGKFLVNEINTMPGFTSISMYGQLMAACGVNQEDLLVQLIERSFQE